MNKKYIWIGAVIVVIILLVTWFNSHNPTVSQPVSGSNDFDVPATQITPDVTTTTPAVPVAVSANAVKEFTVTGGNFFFKPTAITVSKGDTVKITLVNSGGMHDLKIDEFNVATQKIRGGAQETITFVADKAGSFEYYCSVGDHRAMGMKGTFIVQ